MGTDRIGIMAKLTDAVHKNEGNVTSGRMTKLGGDFCVMMLVTVAPSAEEKLSQALKIMEGMG